MTKTTNTNKFTNSRKHGYAVQLYHKQCGDIVYYAGYPDPNDIGADGKPKKKRLKIGTKQEGITEQFVKQKRDEIVVALRLGNDNEILRRKKQKFQEAITLQNLADFYFEFRFAKDDTKQNKDNVKNDLSIFKNHLLELSKVNIENIQLKDVEELRISKLKTRKPNTVNNILRVLSAILNFGVESGKTSNYTPPKIKMNTGIDNERLRYFSNDEIKLILDNILDNPILTMFIKLSLSTGGRLETILAIKSKDINLADGTIALTDYKGKAAGKNNATYSGFLTQNLIDELPSFINNSLPNHYIFSWANGTRISKDYIQDRLQNLFNSLFNQGLDSKDAKNRAVIHSLRHTFATHLIKIGTPIFTVKTLMNHSDIKMTMRYAKFSPENGKNAIDQLNLF